MPQTASQVIAQSGFPGPGIVAMVDQNNNIINFGGAGIPTETTVSVGASSGQALAANSTAKMRQFQNVSNNGIYLSFSGVAATVGHGTYLAPNGGSVLYDRYIPNGVVNAIATASGGSNLLVTEG